MKRLLAACMITVLTACASTPTVGINRPFPKAPNDLKQTCPDLKQIDAKVDKLSDVLNTVTDNYNQYYECKLKTDEWIEWYTNQSKIWGNLK